MNIKPTSILSLYNQKLVSLAFDYKETKIKTSFGKTNIVIAGNNKKPPLFLVHGLNSSAPFALDTLSFLLNKYQIFAIDILGQPNKSDFVRLDKKDTSYGKWMLEIIHHFNVDTYSLYGISFGSFPILKSLLIDEEKVEEVFFISPAGIINGSLFKTIANFLIPLKKFKKTKKDIYLYKCLNNLYNSFDDFTFTFQKEIFLNFEMDFSITPNFKKSDLKKIKTPISIIASENDFFVPALKLKKTSEKSFNALKKFVVLKNRKHIPKKEDLISFS